MKRTERPQQVSGGPPGPEGAQDFGGFAIGAPVYSTAPERKRRHRSREKSMIELRRAEARRKERT